MITNPAEDAAVQELRRLLAETYPLGLLYLPDLPSRFGVSVACVTREVQRARQARRLTAYPASRATVADGATGT